MNSNDLVFLPPPKRRVINNPRKKRQPPRIPFTIRLHQSTVDDLTLFAKYRGLGNKSAVIRYFINLGFASHGNWRLGK